ncbi:hypothetical protein MKX03_023970 [Papaver bracteatum]|nr:hypothetical protein MKX03_023970 [Papaver bracteatum]
MATERAVQFRSSLGNPSFVKTMRHSEVYNGFWLPSSKILRGSPTDSPNHDAMIITLVDLQGVRFETHYLPCKRGLSAGWKGFALQHNLIHQDALIFELTEPTVFRVSDIIIFNLHFSIHKLCCIRP